MGAVLVPVMVPLNVVVSGPPPVAVIRPLRMILLAFNVIPATLFVLRSPSSVIMPVDVRSIETAATALSVLLLQLLTVRAPMRVAAPRPPGGGGAPGPAGGGGAAAPAAGFK